MDSIDFTRQNESEMEKFDLGEFSDLENEFEAGLEDSNKLD